MQGTGTQTVTRTGDATRPARTDRSAGVVGGGSTPPAGLLSGRSPRHARPRQRWLSTGDIHHHTQTRRARQHPSAAARQTGASRSTLRTGTHVAFESRISPPLAHRSGRPGERSARSHSRRVRTEVSSLPVSDWGEGLTAARGNRAHESSSGTEKVLFGTTTQCCAAGSTPGANHPLAARQPTPGPCRAAGRLPMSSVANPPGLATRGSAISFARQLDASGGGERDGRQGTRHGCGTDAAGGQRVTTMQQGHTRRYPRPQARAPPRPKAPPTRRCQ